MTLQKIMQKMTSYVELVLSVFLLLVVVALTVRLITERATAVVAADGSYVLCGKCDDAGNRDRVCKNALYPHAGDNHRDSVVCDIPTNDCGTFVDNRNNSWCRSNRRTFCSQKISVLRNS